MRPTCSTRRGEEMQSAELLLALELAQVPFLPTRMCHDGRQEPLRPVAVCRLTPAPAQVIYPVVLKWKPHGAIIEHHQTQLRRKLRARPLAVQRREMRLRRNKGQGPTP